MAKGKRNVEPSVSCYSSDYICDGEIDCKGNAVTDEDKCPEGAVRIILHTSYLVDDCNKTDRKSVV